MIPVQQPHRPAAPARTRFRLATPATATVLGVVALVLTALTATLTGLTHQLTVQSVVTGVPIPLVYGGVGVIVARHQPRNPVGWLLIGFVVLFLIPVDAGHYAVLRYRLGYHQLPFGPAAVVLVSTWALAFALFALVLLLFPDGRLTARRWRWVLCAYAVLVAYLVVVNIAQPLAADAHHAISVNSSGDVAYRLSGWVTRLTPIVYLAIGAIWLSFAGHQVLSWRRATGERRQQLKWLACGAAVTLCVGPLGSVVGSTAVSNLLEVGVVALPAGIGVGIMKYRLYEIDRIISRTLAYAIVTGLLVGVYTGLVLLATEVLRVHTPVAVAAATLAAAALFNPLRRRVQRTVDRRFNRARYDAEQTVAAFAGRLKDAVDLNVIRDDLAGVVQQALEPAHVSVWLSGRDALPIRGLRLQPLGGRRPGLVGVKEHPAAVAVQPEQRGQADADDIRDVEGEVVGAPEPMLHRGHDPVGDQDPDTVEEEEQEGLAPQMAALAVPESPELVAYEREHRGHGIGQRRREDRVHPRAGVERIKQDDGEHEREPAHDAELGDLVDQHLETRVMIADRLHRGCVLSCRPRLNPTLSRPS